MGKQNDNNYKRIVEQVEAYPYDEEFYLQQALTFPLKTHHGARFRKEVDKEAIHDVFWVGKDSRANIYIKRMSKK